MTTMREYREVMRGKIIRGGRFFCWHRFDVDTIRGVWWYRQCKKCGRRFAIRTNARLAGPVDWSWLESGEWMGSPIWPPPFPTRPSNIPPAGEGARHE